MKTSIIDLNGRTFGNWTVEKLSKKRTNRGGTYWWCLCSCGQRAEVSSCSLVGNRSSGCCGCRRKKTEKPMCPKGHSIDMWGRTSSYSCRGCVKEKSLLRNYGITLADFISMWEAQFGKCAICGKELKLALGKPGFDLGCRTEVDHRHGMKKTAKRDTVRGLLCGGRWSGCNRRLGRIDNAEWLKAAMEYVATPPAQAILKKRAA